MTPERWQEIERLYHAARERDPDERPAFLAAACGSDDALRREVETLLVHLTSAGDFIETPAVEAHRSLLLAADDVRRRLEEQALPGRFAGTTFGSYEIKALIAAGGMGEVYRAVDTRLNRTVAIKTLPEHLSADPARRERFKREAKIVSSLNHPHICTLYDVGNHDDVHYLVMEHIEGETLQARLERGALPLDLALEYSIQIADALDKAHRRGVTHRDLKPANIMLTTSGVKLLDFGLATRSAPLRGVALDNPTPDSSEGLTVEGTFMGTMQYTSPEQLEGKPSDARADIFSFGAVAYEMITGRRAFQGTSHARLISAIVDGNPQPIIEVVPDTPLVLDRTFLRCLAKSPDDRWQTASDLLFQLRSFAAAPDWAQVPGRRPRVLGRLSERALWMTAVAAALAVSLLWVGRARVANPPPMNPPISFPLFPAEGTTIYSGYDVPFQVSPDGRRIVYVAVKADGTKELRLRSWESPDEHSMPGTDGAQTPFWSPDSGWIGFFADGNLKKVRVSNGLVQQIAGSVSTVGGAAWNRDDVIVFPLSPGGLSRVSAQGGPVTRVTTGEGSHFWPQFLDDGDHFIYAASLPPRICIGSLANGTPSQPDLMAFPMRVSALAHVPGYVFFVQDAVLYARRFDEARLQFSGEAHHVVDGVPLAGPGRAAFSVSAAGVLAFWSYSVGTPAVLQWFDRTGRAAPVVGGPAQYLGFDLSQNGQVVYSRTAPNGTADVWTGDVVGGPEHQVTFDGASYTPQWSPDSTSVAFSSPNDRLPPNIFTKRLSDASPASRVSRSTMPDFPSSWTRDGSSIVGVRIDSASGNDLWVHRLQHPEGERLWFNTQFNESQGSVSPDSRWIAYVSDESGKDEVWVASFPSGDIRHQVSASGGISPRWGESSREIFYISLAKELMAAPFAQGRTGIAVGPPHVLFKVDNLVDVERRLFPSANAYVSAADGHRFLMAVRVRDPKTPPISIVVNWPALLNR
jgi:eukaryotic-like serine/threonine-protein kinase